MTKSEKPNFYLGFSGKKTNEIKKGQQKWFEV